MINDWITIGEAADLLQVSRDTLRRWEKKGKISSYRSPSNRRMYKKSEITEAYQQADDIETQEQHESEAPNIALVSPTYKPVLNKVQSISSNNYSVNTTPINNPFTSPAATFSNLSNSNENPITQVQSNDAFTANKMVNSSKLTSEPEPKYQNQPWAPPLSYKKPSYLQSSSSNQNPSHKEATQTHISSNLQPINSSTNSTDAKLSIPQSTTSEHNIPLPPTPLSFPNLTNSQINNLHSNSPAAKTSDFSFNSPRHEIPSSTANPSNDSFFSYPSLVSSNSYTARNPQINDYTFESAEEEKPDSTIKILKVITAILITILIILGGSIFAIIFMQYR